MVSVRGNRGVAVPIICNHLLCGFRIIHFWERQICVRDTDETGLPG